MFEIFGPIFEQNVTINLQPFLNKMQISVLFSQKSAYFGPIFEKSVNFENFVNGRWTHYKSHST